jgi:ELWxxDGT repeat protein
MLLSGAALVKDIVPGTGSSVSFGAHQEAALGNLFIFAANDGAHGIEPWVSDGTDAGTTILKDINIAGSSNPDQFVVGNGVVYFTANDGSSVQIWQTNGTPAGTGPLTAVPSTPDARQAVFTAFSGTTLFFTEDGDSFVASLWAMDVSKPGTAVELTNFGGVPNSLPMPLATVNGRLFFDANDGNDNDQLWTSDGTPGGTGPIDVINPGGAAGISGPGIAFNGQVFFNAGQGLWKSDGTAAGTFQVGSTLFKNDVPGNFTVSGGTLYFTGDSGSGFQIWSTDGTKVTPVTALNTTSGSIQNLTDVNGTLFFSASTGGGAKVLYDLVNGKATQVPLPSDGSGTIANQLTNVNGTLFFSALNTAGQQTLFDFDGTSINAIVKTDPGLTPLGLLNVNGTLFYSADETATGRELYSATPTGTEPLTVDLGPNITIDEGEITPITFHAIVTGLTPVKFAWNTTGKGYKILGKKGDTETAAYFASPVGDVTVKVAVRTTDGRIARGSVVVHIRNVAPEVKLTYKLPTKYPVLLPYVAIPFTATWDDPGPNDKFKVTWDFGDGVHVDQVVGHNHKATFPHAYSRVGGFVPRVTVTDMDNGTGSDNPLFPIVVVNLTVARVKTGLELLLGGTGNKDVFQLIADKLTPAPKGEQPVEVLMNGVSEGIFTVSKVIGLFNVQNQVKVDPSVKIPVSITKTK